MLNGQVPPETLEEACGTDPTYVCKRLLELTDSQDVAETGDLLLSKPFSILLIVVIAWVVLALLHRVIDRFVGSLAGQNKPARRIKRTLRRAPIVASTLPDSVLETGNISIRAAARAQTLGHVLHSIAAFTVWTIAGITILGELGINLGPLIAGRGHRGHRARLRCPEPREGLPRGDLHHRGGPVRRGRHHRRRRARRAPR